MIASAYTYHHRGMEPGSSVAPPNIINMDPAEGVPAIAKTMHPIIEMMVKAYQANQGDFYTVKFEELTRSSEDFDATVAKIFDFIYGDLITPEERKEIEIEAQNEDLHRGENGRS